MVISQFGLQHFPFFDFSSSNLVHPQRVFRFFSRFLKIYSARNLLCARNTVHSVSHSSHSDFVVCSPFFSNYLPIVLAAHSRHTHLPCASYLLILSSSFLTLCRLNSEICAYAMTVQIVWTRARFSTIVILGLCQTKPHAQIGYNAERRLQHPQTEKTYPT